MAGKVRHLLNRDGRYFARLVIPKDLRRHLDGKTELRTALGPDYRTALRLLPGAVAELQHRIAVAERSAAGQAGRAVALNRYPLAPAQLAHRNYQDRLALDEHLRNGDSRYASFGYVDEGLVIALRAGMAGKLSDEQLFALVGERIERYRHLENTAVAFGTTEWRTVARALCISEYEALARVAERDEGDFGGAPEHPLIIAATPPDQAAQPVSLTGLWSDYVASRMQAGFMRDKGQRQRPVIENLRKFLKHDDAGRITKKDLMAWRDKLMPTLNAMPTPVKKNDLVGLTAEQRALHDDLKLMHEQEKAQLAEAEHKRSDDAATLRNHYKSSVTALIDAAKRNARVGKT